MTIKELKNQIKEMPDNAEAVFALWQSDDKYTYFVIKKSNNKIKNINAGGQVAIIGVADNCRADMMIERNNGSFDY